MSLRYVGLAYVLTTSLLAQTKEDALEKLRNNIRAQEQAAKVIAWTAHTTIEDFVQGSKAELVSDCTYQTESNGNAHVWVDASYTNREGGKVRRLFECALFEGQSGIIFELNAGENRLSKKINYSYKHANDAGANLTFLPRGNDRKSLSQLLESKPSHIKDKEKELEVGLIAQDGIWTYRFAKRGDNYALIGLVEEGKNGIVSHEVVVDKLIEGKVWFPQQIRVKQLKDGKEVEKRDIHVTKAGIDPKLDENTFTLVAPLYTRFFDMDESKQKTLTKNNPIGPIVKLKTDTVKVPTFPIK